MSHRTIRYVVLGLIGSLAGLFWWSPPWVAGFIDSQQAWALLTVAVIGWVLWTFISVALPVISSHFQRLKTHRTAKQFEQTVRQYARDNEWSLRDRNGPVAEGTLEGFPVRIDAPLGELIARYYSRASLPPFVFSTFDDDSANRDLSSVELSPDALMQLDPVFKASPGARSIFSSTPRLQTELNRLYSAHGSHLSDLVIDNRGAIAYLDHQNPPSLENLENLTNKLTRLLELWKQHLEASDESTP